MKTTVSVLAVLLFCAAVAAQDLPKIAVYVTGNVGADEKKALGTRMLASLVNSGRYVGIERSSSFLAEIEREQVKQRSGAIDDSQISEVGRQFGVKFICIADITPAFGEFQVSARIVNVETAVVAHIGESSGQLSSMADLSRVSDKVVENMFVFNNQTTPAPLVPAQPAQPLPAQSVQTLPAPPVPAQPEQPPPPPATGGTTGFDDIFLPSEKGMTLTAAMVNYTPKMVFYTRTNVVDVTGTADRGTIVLNTQTLNKKMQPLTKDAAKGEKRVANVYDGVVTLSAPEDPSGKVQITVVAPLKLPSKLSVGDVLPNAEHTMKMGMMTIRVSTTGRKCTGVETITVPAGTFECYKIEQQATTTINKSKTPPFYQTVWLARGIGDVKMTQYDSKGKLTVATELQKIEGMSGVKTLSAAGPAQPEYGRYENRSNSQPESDIARDIAEPTNKVSIGFGGFMNGDLNTLYTGWGLHAYLDLIYAEVFAALQGGDDERWASGQGSSHSSYTNIGVFLKYPFEWFIITHFPLVGIDYETLTSGRYNDHGDWQDVGVQNDHSLWFKFGYGADINTLGRLYIRYEFLLGWILSGSRTGYHNIDMNNPNFGITLKGGFGFKF